MKNVGYGIVTGYSFMLLQTNKLTIRFKFSTRHCDRCWHYICELDTLFFTSKLIILSISGYEPPNYCFKLVSISLRTNKNSYLKDKNAVLFLFGVDFMNQWISRP